MRVDRKTFLRLSGLSLLALAGKKLIGAFAGARQAAPPAPSGALTAGRWAMVVDLEKCRKQQGCDRCIQACHKVHNVPEMPRAAHQIKWIWKEPFDKVFASQQTEYMEAALATQPALVFCNHCDQPPCVRVCPTQATWKRADGIVMMDWHRCIGCRYCVAGCPYGSRSFNWLDPRPHIKQLDPGFPTRAKGVVEKCTFCEERLARGQSPACVEACQDKALVFGDLADAQSEVRGLLRARYSLRRKPELGTKPEVYYIL